MRVWLLGLVAAVGCSGSDPSLGGATWMAMPASGLPTPLFDQALSRWSGTQVAVYTINSDEETHCSEVEGVNSGTLELVFNSSAVARPGAVPIAVALDPALPTATLKLGSRVYTGGMVTITSVDGGVEATFDATEPMSTLHGSVDATRCD